MYTNIAGNSTWNNSSFVCINETVTKSNSFVKRTLSMSLWLSYCPSLLSNSKSPRDEIRWSFASLRSKTTFVFVLFVSESHSNWRLSCKKNFLTLWYFLDNYLTLKFETKSERKKKTLTRLSKDFTKVLDFAKYWIYLKLCLYMA